MHDDGIEIPNEEQRPPPPIDAPAYLNGHRNGHRPRAEDPVPHDLDAERAVLGACLISRTAVDDALDQGLQTADFWSPAHGHVWAAIIELRGNGEPVDVVAVAAELRASGLLDVVGGGAGVSAIAADTAATSSVAHHAGVVIELAIRRRVWKAAGEIRDVARDLTLDIGDVVARADQHLTNATAEAPTAARALTVHWVHDTVLQPAPVDDDLVAGILAPGEITGIGANRNVGKSWIVMNLADLCARGQGLFLGELPIRRPARTLLCHGEMNQRGAHGRWHHLTGDAAPPAGVGETFDQWRLRVVERRTMTFHAGGSQSDRRYDVALDSTLERTIAEHGIDVLIIDPWRVYYAGSENSSDEVEAALDKLRALAVAHQLAVVIVHHLRGGTDGDATDPEDAWRGSTRLPDAVDTRITLLPHYTRRQAAEQGMSRKQARRYQDVYFLRRGGPAPDDFGIAWDPTTGWWNRWRTPQELGAELGGRPTHYNPIDVVPLLEEAGGAWSSIRLASEALELSPTATTKLLERAAAAGYVEEFSGPKGARAFRLPGTGEPTIEEGSDGMF